MKTKKQLKKKLKKLPKILEDWEEGMFGGFYYFKGGGYNNPVFVSPKKAKKLKKLRKKLKKQIKGFKK